MNVCECVACAFERCCVKTDVYKAQTIERRTYIRKIQEIVVLALRITEFNFTLTHSFSKHMFKIIGFTPV